MPTAVVLPQSQFTERMFRMPTAQASTPEPMDSQPCLSQDHMHPTLVELRAAQPYLHNLSWPTSYLQWVQVPLLSIFWVLETWSLWKAAISWLLQGWPNSDVSTGATSMTVIAPKLSDTLTLFQPGVGGGADSAHHQHSCTYIFVVELVAKITSPLVLSSIWHWNLTNFVHFGKQMFGTHF